MGFSNDFAPKFPSRCLPFSIFFFLIYSRIKTFQKRKLEIFRSGRPTRVVKKRNKMAFPAPSKSHKDMVEAAGSSPEEEVVKTSGRPCWFKPKQGSVLPARRRLVKTLVFWSILHCISSLFCRPRRRRPCSSSAVHVDICLAN